MAGVPVINLSPLSSQIHPLSCFVILELDAAVIPLLPAGTTLGFVLLQYIWGMEKEPPGQGEGLQRADQSAKAQAIEPRQTQ